MKYVFWIHSSTSYYMAKAIIAKENLDCHNVVYLIDRNYANKYHNNIDNEISSISISILFKIKPCLFLVITLFTQLLRLISFTR